MKAPPTEEVVVFAPMGGNPSLLVTLAWKLWSERRWRVVAAFAPVLVRGREWAEKELLASGGALEQLHCVTGREVLPRAELDVRVVNLPDGSPVGDEDTAEAALAYQEAVFADAKRAVARAGDRPIVFALIAGRRRTMTVAAATVAQLLARRQDRVVDLRIRPQEAIQPGAFVFPQQQHRHFLGTDGRKLDARDVVVELVDVLVPRIGALDPKLATAPTYTAAMARGQSAIDDAASIRLEIVLEVRERGAYVTDERTGETEKIPLADTHLLYLASLCLGHEEQPDATWLEVVKLGQPEHPFARLCRELDWGPLDRSDAVLAFRPTTLLTKNHRKALASKTLPQLRSKARRALTKFAEARDPRYRALVPVVEKSGPNSRERLPLRRVAIRR